MLRDLAVVHYTTRWKILCAGKEQGYKYHDRVCGLDLTQWRKAKTWAYNRVDHLIWQLRRVTAIAYYDKMKPSAYMRNDIECHADFDIMVGTVLDWRKKHYRG